MRSWILLVSDPRNRELEALFNKGIFEMTRALIMSVASATADVRYSAIIAVTEVTPPNENDLVTSVVFAAASASRAAAGTASEAAASYAVQAADRSVSALGEAAVWALYPQSDKRAALHNHDDEEAALVRSQAEVSAITEIQEDFSSLQALQHIELVPRSFFERPLWSAEPPHWWKPVTDLWMSAMGSLGHDDLGRLYIQVSEGIFDPRGLALQVEGWTRPASDPVVEKDLPPQIIEIKNTGTEPPVIESTKPDTKAASSLPEKSRILSGSYKDPDALDRARVANVLADFICDRNTIAPLTLSIEGTWGSGKTWLMSELEKRIKNIPKDSKTKHRLTPVWFNPIRYKGQEELWAAFAHTVLRETRKNLPWYRRLWADVRTTWTFCDRLALAKSAIFLFLTSALASFLVLTLAPIFQGGWSSNLLNAQLLEPGTWAIILGVGPGLASLAVALFKALDWIRSNTGSLLEAKLELHMNRPNYEGKLGFLAQFHKDFPEALRILCGDTPVVVMIDDLDRCDVPMASDLLLGINLMLGDEAPMICVLGIDRTKVAAGLAVKHRELLPFLYAGERQTGEPEDEKDYLFWTGLRYGYEFVEKFIQVPFRLPQTEEGNIRTYVRQQLVKDPDKEPLMKKSLAARFAGFLLSKRTSENKQPSGSSISRNTAVPKGEATKSITPNDPGSQPYPTTIQPIQTIQAPLAEEQVSDDAHLEEPLVYASSVLEGNPRRVKLLINLVRLQRRLAREYRMSRVKDGHLAKWTAVALRWPLFLVDLEREPTLLDWMATSQPVGINSPTYHRWMAEHALVDLIHGTGPKGANAADYLLNDHEVIRDLLKLGISVPIAAVSAAAQTPSPLPK